MDASFIEGERVAQEARLAKRNLLRVLEGSFAKKQTTETQRHGEHIGECPRGLVFKLVCNLLELIPGDVDKERRPLDNLELRPATQMRTARRFEAQAI